jgi:D-3-phosphoglycerate dehydrogenase
VTRDRLRVLVSCPPMLELLNEFEPAFRAAGISVVRAATTQTLSEDELITLLPEFDGWIIGDDPASAAVLNAACAGRLRAAVKWGVGIDNVDFAAARALGLNIVHTPGVFGREVADLVMGYVVALARETMLIDRGVRDMCWPKPTGISLAGRTVAIVGFGDIGRQAAKRLIASEMHVIVYDPVFRPEPALTVDIAPWPHRIGEADFLIFACPLNDSTRGMFSYSLLGALKPGVRVVNVGRGPVIVHDALLEGLERAIVHSAALDVFETEPLPAGSALRNYPRCIFGSHNASNTADAVRRVSRLVMDFLFAQLGVDQSEQD